MLGCKLSAALEAGAGRVRQRALPPSLPVSFAQGHFCAPCRIRRSSITSPLMR
jgi:hypothetical protein